MKNLTLYMLFLLLLLTFFCLCAKYSNEEGCS